MFESLKKWIAEQRQNIRDQALAVEFDECGFKISRPDASDPRVNRSSAWSNLRQVSLWRSSNSRSDHIHLRLKDEPELVRNIPVKSHGGQEFLAALCARGFLAETNRGRALRRFFGGTYYGPER